MPTTIRAIEIAVSERLGDEVRFHGMEPTALVLIATVEEMLRQAASLELRLNDGTGRLQARFYLTEDSPEGLELSDLAAMFPWSAMCVCIQKLTSLSYPFVRSLRLTR